MDQGSSHSNHCKPVSSMALNYLVFNATTTTDAKVRFHCSNLEKRYCLLFNSVLFKAMLKQ
jgi:hypothetical protein